MNWNNTPAPGDPGRGGVLLCVGGGRFVGGNRACRNVLAAGSRLRPTNRRKGHIFMVCVSFGRRGGLQAARVTVPCRERPGAAATFPSPVGRGLDPAVRSCPARNVPGWGNVATPPSAFGRHPRVAVGASCGAPWGGACILRPLPLLRLAASAACGGQDKSPCGSRCGLAGAFARNVWRKCQALVSDSSSLPCFSHTV